MATQSYSQGEPNLVNDPIDTSSETTFSSLPETLSLPSTPSLSQISPSIFPLNISYDIETRYSEQSTNIPLRLDWNTFVAPPPLLGQHNESHRLHSWAPIKEYNTKLSTRPNTYDEEHNNVDTIRTAPQVPTRPQNHPLSLVSRNFRNLAITNNPNFRPHSIHSPIQHITTNHSQNDSTYDQIIEQPHTTTFQSQNNHFFSTR